MGGEDIENLRRELEAFGRLESAVYEQLSRQPHTGEELLTCYISDYSSYRCDDKRELLCNDSVVVN